MALQILLTLAQAAGLLIVYLGVGSFLYSRICRQPDISLLSTMAKLLLGFGAVGNCIMLMRFCGMATPSGIRGLLSVLFFTSLPLSWMEHTAIRRNVVMAFALITGKYKFAIVAVLTLLAGYLLAGLLPPIDHNGLLESAKLFLAHGGFDKSSFDPYSDTRMLTELNYTIGLAFGNVLLCKAIAFFFVGMCCAGIAVVCRRVCNSAWLTMPAILIFLAFANTIARLGCCNSDGVLAVCMLLSVVFGERFRESSRIRYALLAGIFCGFAMETQSFGVLVVPLAATQVLLSRVKKSQTPILASMAALIIPALLLALPWYLNSFANTGIPSICNLSALPNSSVGSSPNTTVSLPMAPGIFNGLRHIGSASWSFTLFGHLHRTNALGLLPFVAMPFMLFANLPIKIRYVLLWIVLFLVQLIAIELWIIPGGSVFRHSLFLLLLSSPLVVWLISHLSNRPVLR